MAVQFVASSNAAGATTVSPTTPTGTIEGDYMIAVLSCANAVTITPPTVNGTWTLLGSNTVTAPYIYIYGKASNGAGGNIPFSVTDRVECVLSTYRYAEFDAIGSFVRQFSGSTVLDIPAVSLSNTTYGRGAFVAIASAGSNLSNLWTPPSGYIEREDVANAGNSRNIFLADCVNQLVGNSGTVSPTSSIFPQVGVLVSLRATPVPDFVYVGPIVPTAGTSNSSGSNKLKLSDSSFSVTTTSTANAGSLVCVVASIDNYQSENSESSNLTGITDSAGNNWIKIGEYTNGQGAPGEGAVVALFYSKLTNALVSGGTITMSFTNTGSAQAACALHVTNFELNNTEEKRLTFVSPQFGIFNAPASPPSRTLSGLSTGITYLAFRAIGSEGTNTVNITPTSGWTTSGHGSSGTSASTISAREEHIIFNNATSITSNPGSLNADGASLITAFYLTDANVRGSVNFAGVANMTAACRKTARGSTAISGSGIMSASATHVRPLAATGAQILAAHYNALSGKTASGAGSSAAATGIAGYLWGVGYGDRGYGQTTPTLINTYAASTPIGQEWADLRSVINSLATWQNSSVPSLPTAGQLAVGKTILKPTAFQQALGIVDAQRLNYQAGNMTLVSSATSTTRDTAWGAGEGSISCTLQVEFINENRTRYFFNTGGELRLGLSHPSTATSQDSNWNSILNNLVVAFRANDTVRLTGSTGAERNIGYYQLTTSFQTIYDGTNAGSGSYAANDYLIEARSVAITGLQGAKGSIIQFRITLTDQYINSVYAGYDSVAAGTVATLSHLRATKTIVIAAPTCSVITAF